MNSLRVEVAGLVLPNPTVLASGIMGETGGSLLRAAAAGAGAVVTKSIGSEPRPGYQNPTLVELDDGYINAMGLPNPGVVLAQTHMFFSSSYTVAPAWISSPACRQSMQQ